MKKVIDTEFGKSYLNNGYYTVYTKSEGNFNQRLHRLIYEKNFGKIPNGYVVHHKDGNKSNNCIMNLELMTVSEHNSFHSKGKNHPLYGTHCSKETKQKIREANTGKKQSLKQKIKKSSAKNTTRIFRVCKHNKPKTKQGFTWVYQYYDGKGKRKSVSSVDLHKLKQKVLNKGLEWREI